MHFVVITLLISASALRLCSALVRYAHICTVCAFLMFGTVFYVPDTELMTRSHPSTVRFFQHFPFFRKLGLICLCVRAMRHCRNWQAMKWKRERCEVSIMSISIYVIVCVRKFLLSPTTLWVCETLFLALDLAAGSRVLLSLNRLGSINSSDNWRLIE